MADEPIPYGFAPPDPFEAAALRQRNAVTRRKEGMPTRVLDALGMGLYNAATLPKRYIESGADYQPGQRASDRQPSADLAAEAGLMMMGGGVPRVGASAQTVPRSIDPHMVDFIRDYGRGDITRTLERLETPSKRGFWGERDAMEKAGAIRGLRPEYERALAPEAALRDYHRIRVEPSSSDRAVREAYDRVLATDIRTNPLQQNSSLPFYRDAAKPEPTNAEWATQMRREDALDALPVLQQPAMSRFAQRGVPYQAAENANPRLSPPIRSVGETRGNVTTLRSGFDEGADPIAAALSRLVTQPTSRPVDARLGSAVDTLSGARAKPSPRAFEPEQSSYDFANAMARMEDLAARGQLPPGTWRPPEQPGLLDRVKGMFGGERAPVAPQPPAPLSLAPPDIPLRAPEFLSQRARTQATLPDVTFSANAGDQRMGAPLAARNMLADMVADQAAERALRNSLNVPGQYGGVREPIVAPPNPWWMDK